VRRERRRSKFDLVVELLTPRLVLRQWRAADLEPFAALNADPEVMQYFPAPLSREQSDALANDAASAISQRGWGLWAVEVSEAGAFIGFVGLSIPEFEAHFTPAVEIGWRLARGHWGNGYATRRRPRSDRVRLRRAATR
jgi:RimJ/RimL family protein N-acetyltransferase